MLELDIKKPPQLNELIYKQLREAIVKGDIPLNTTLTQEQLAQQIGVSRTPVRDALERLMREGFVTRSDEGRIIVAVLSLEELREKYQVRKVLEGLAARQAANYISKEQLDSLWDILECTHDVKNSEEALSCGMRFHDVIMDACQNNFLKKTIKDINDSLRRYRSLETDIPGQKDESIREHEEIYKALETGDGETADLMMQKHIAALSNQLEIIWFKSQKE